MKNINQNQKSFLIKVSVLMLLLVMGKGFHQANQEEERYASAISPLELLSKWVANQPGFTLIDKIKNI